MDPGSPGPALVTCMLVQNVIASCGVRPCAPVHDVVEGAAANEMTAPTVSRLRSLFAPRRVAIVGASEKSLFSRIAHTNLVSFGMGGRTHLVNRGGGTVHGQDAVCSCAELPEGVDVAFLMVPRRATIESLKDAAAAGIRNAVVLSSGYAEAGATGIAAQEELVDTAHSLDMLVLGPNHLGFVNVVDGVPVTSMPDLPRIPGPVALVAQSGATAGSMVEFAAMSGIGFSHVVTTGNEAMVTTSDVLDYLVDDEHTRAVALFVETIRRPDRFLSAVARARAAGKAIVALKLGTSELTARTAMAHTGALVGDDRVAGAVFRQYGVIRVDSVEDLLLTAHLAAFTGPLRHPAAAFTSISGGACDVIADRAQDLGLPLTTLSPQTVDRVRRALPAYGTPQNPLDVTGAVVHDPPLFTTLIDTVANDPGVGIVATVFDLPWEPAAAGHGAAAMCRAIGAGLSRAPVPAVLVNQTSRPVSEYTRALMAEYEVPFVLGGLRQAVVAMAGIAGWSVRCARADVPVARPQVSVPPSAERTGTWSETAARDLFLSAGVPVVPGELVGSEEAAGRAAAGYSSAALKVVSADIAHKSEVGGVRLGVVGDQAARAAYRGVVESARRAVPAARIDGVLVSPMRTSGVELLVGVTRNPDWGLVLAVALGGVFVEVLDDAALRRLPVTREDVVEMLGELRGRPVLDGVRGQPPVDIDALVDVVCRITELATALGGDLESLEVNPLHATGSGAEVLDALVTWQATASS